MYWSNLSKSGISTCNSVKDLNTSSTSEWHRQRCEMKEEQANVKNVHWQLQYKILYNIYKIFQKLGKGKMSVTTEHY